MNHLLPSNLFAILLFQHYFDFVETKSVLAPNQFGFRSDRSAFHAILNLVTSIYDNINSKKYLGTVTLDLSKAFDTVCHDRLLIKLEYHGVRSPALMLLNSYLKNRFQNISLNNTNSKRKK